MDSCCSATYGWAKKVFPDKDSEEAIKLLWEKIFECSRIQLDTSNQNWKTHNENLEKNCQFLNKYQFTKLYIESNGNATSKGTKLEVGLPENHIWIGGSELNSSGISFNANIPTEEVFTAPSKKYVNGYVSNSKPLNYNGYTIDNFTLYFVNGEVVDFHAEIGQEILEKLINTDSGSKYLGEIALVPFDSPISNSNIIFYNTLYDENASCHLALGEAYPSCIKDGVKLTESQLEDCGLNTSLIHEDFMFGSFDTNIIGSTKSGEELTIFKNGNWVIF